MTDNKKKFSNNSNKVRKHKNTTSWLNLVRYIKIRNLHVNEIDEKYFIHLKISSTKNMASC